MPVDVVKLGTWCRRLVGHGHGTGEGKLEQMGRRDVKVQHGAEKAGPVQEH